MSRSLPFQRSSQAARARLNKAQLLPIPRAVAGDLALRAHLSLEAIRGACDHIGPAQHITEVVLLGKFLSEAGHGEFSHESLLAADRAMAEVFEGGRENGTWGCRRSQPLRCWLRSSACTTGNSIARRSAR